MPFKTSQEITLANRRNANFQVNLFVSWIVSESVTLLLFLWVKGNEDTGVEIVDANTERETISSKQKKR